MLSEIERKIIKRMNRLGLWKSNHLKLENIMRTGFPGHQLGEVKKAIKGLIQKGLVVYYSKSKRAIQLNYHKYHKIREIVDKNGNN